MLSVVGPGALDLLTERARAGHPYRLHYSVHRSQMILHSEKRVAGHVVFANTDLSVLDLLVFMINAIIEERDEKMIDPVSGKEYPEELIKRAAKMNNIGYDALIEHIKRAEWFCSRMGESSNEAIQRELALLRLQKPLLFCSQVKK